VTIAAVMSMRATEGIEELQRIITEFGDAEMEMPDPLEGQWRNPVDRIEFDSERQSILFVSDR
jgi:hypothetical protein